MGAESSLIFEPIKHEYRFNSVVVPSVTQILESLGFSDFGFATPEIMEAARARGEDVHKATELLDIGKLDWTTISDEIAPYVIAYQAFKNEVRPEIIAIEKRVYHPVFKFAGTLDRVYRIGGDLDLVDLKAGTAQPSHKLQSAGYSSAWDHEHLPLMRIKKRHALYLMANGRYKFVEHNDAIDRPTFIAAIQVFHWRKNNS